ncbi:MAG: GNAT family N-acetyltransferase [Desulfomonile tiedjei]|nr:GNAT family N-acetyltransferase [Desulfomonile tiedjei]
MSNTGTKHVEFTEYYPGVLGRITELHATYYHENWGFDLSFEIQVARELAEFMSRFNESRDGLWVAKSENGLAGAVAIDGDLSETEGARLRWFIVEPVLQGRGVGRQLIKKAVEFCIAAGHRKVFLWTFKGLDSARSLYELEGFRLLEEHDVNQWGQQIQEQKFELIL